MTEIITKYFPNLTAKQREQFALLGSVYPEWNEKINVISRKDIDNLYPNHILHSLSIASFWGELEEGTAIMDLGTGGGFPGIPLAVVYPQCHFHLIDRVGKKLKVVQDVVARLGLDNVTIQHGDVGECRQKFDYVVSRAVMSLDALVKAAMGKVKGEKHNRYAPGIICLKGGDLAEEIKRVEYPVVEYGINEFFAEEYFETKKLIYVPKRK